MSTLASCRTGRSLQKNAYKKVQRDLGRPLLQGLERTDVFIKPDEDLGEVTDPALHSDQGSNYNNNSGTVAFFK